MNDCDEQTSGDSQDQPDDREPSPERQAELEAAYQANNAADSPPYWGVRIRTLGELKWVIAKDRRVEAPHASDGFERADRISTNLQGVDLSYIILKRVNLSHADLLKADLSHATLQEVDLSYTILTDADLSNATLERVDLSHATLWGAHLSDARLERVNLSYASLDGANLSNAELFKADLTRAELTHTDLSSAKLWSADLSGATLIEADFSSANLGGSHMDSTTSLIEVIFSASTRFADVIWNNTPLAFIIWEKLPRLGDEELARHHVDINGIGKDAAKRLWEYQAAGRSYRQLAVALRGQGLNEDADRFAYRGQLMQRIVLRRRHRYLRYIGSLLLDLLAGYGYRPGRAILLYLAVILWFANFYFWASHGLITFGLPRSQVQPLAWYEALILSVSSFHGRGFQPFQHLNDPVAALAGIQAVFGLIIEISFIATFTQRFFGK